MFALHVFDATCFFLQSRECLLDCLRGKLAKEKGKQHSATPTDSLQKSYRAVQEGLQVTDTSSALGG